jgi:hypothetical protein
MYKYIPLLEPNLRLLNAACLNAQPHCPASLRQISPLELFNERFSPEFYRIYLSA